MEIGSYYNFFSNSRDKKLFFNSGREAIKFIINNLNSKRCLIPNYLCKSIYDCFTQFDFYKINNNLSIDFENIELLINNNTYDLILVINYFGYIDESLPLIKDLCSNKQIIILEDFTHNLFSDNLYGDICISSFRKTLSTPYGAIVIVRNKNIFFKQKTTINIFYILLNTLKIFSMGLKSYDKLKFIWYPLLNYCENKVECIKYDGFDYINHLFYKYYLTIENKNQRIDNIKYIHANSIVKTPDKFIDTYFCYPIFCKDKAERDSMRNYLISKKIYCPIYWPLDFDKHNNCNHYIADRIIALPIDHRYDTTHMNYILSNLNTIYSGNRIAN